MSHAASLNGGSWNINEAAKKLGVKTSEEPGEAAFYGPKIDFVVKDVIGREWQLCRFEQPDQQGGD